MIKFMTLFASFYKSVRLAPIDGSHCWLRERAGCVYFSLPKAPNQGDTQASYRQVITLKDG